MEQTRLNLSLIPTAPVPASAPATLPASSVLTAPGLPEEKETRGAASSPSRQSVHFRSQTDLWATPQAFFDQWNRRFGFELDVCALPHNAKCARYFTPAEDGLRQRWTGICWMNPPYGREIGKWVHKAYLSAQEGATVVCLLPARTDTRWWHTYVMRASELHFIQGRLKFGDSKNSAPFPSAVAVFCPPTSLFLEKSKKVVDKGGEND